MLIKNIDDLKLYTEPLSGTSWKALQPSIRNAQNKFLIPAIGTALYVRMDNSYNGLNNQTLGANETALLPYIQDCLANYALYQFIVRNQVAVSDMGVKRNETENQKTAYRYQSEEVRDSYLNAGHDARERMVEYLELNRTQFTEWNSSIARVKANKLLIRSGTELQEYYSSIKYPQSLYLSILSMIENVEDLTIKKILGGTFADIKAKQVAGTLGEEETAVLPLLKKSIAYFSMSFVLKELQVQIDGTGVSILTDFGDTTKGGNNNRKSADDNKVAMLSAQNAVVGKEYLKQAIDYIKDHVAETIFPLWYTERVLPGLELRPNSNVNKDMGGAYSPGMSSGGPTRTSNCDVTIVENEFNWDEFNFG